MQWVQCGSWDPVNGNQGEPDARIRVQLDGLPFTVLSDGTRWRWTLDARAWWGELRTPELAIGQSATYYVSER